MRRAFTGMLILAMLCTPLMHALSTPQAAIAQESTSATTTDFLNLRNQASLSGGVIVVIPRGGSLVVRGAAQNGFLPVTYQGTQGWAHSDYIAVSRPSGSSHQTGTVTEALNFRIGPSTGQRSIMVLPAGANVTVTGTSSNGYLAITYGGYSGYAHGDWIRTGSGNTAPPPAVTPAPTAVPNVPSPTGNGQVTEGLNFRTQANTSSAVIQVLPAGATVKLTGRSSGDFLQLEYNGRTGWAHKSWIKIDGSSEPSKPVPAPAPPVTNVQGNARVTEDLNLRSQATTSSSILATMPAGASIKLTGKVSGLFYQVEYNGRTGWAHKDWIEKADSTVTPSKTARVSEAVNLREGPATEYKRILVLPAGATVTVTGQQSNGFHSVSYNGTAGWAFSTYLVLNESQQNLQNLPVVPPGSGNSDNEPYPPITTNQGFHYTNAIVGPTRGTPEQAIEYAKRAGSLHIADVQLYVYEIYRLAPTLGFDPSLLVAQSALETGYWKSKWWDERLNPAGLGINDDPSTHPYSAKFPNGTIAARAQLAHMHAEVYGDRVALPRILQGVDVTYERVFQAGWAGTVVTLEDLSGTWATDPQYGWKISRVASYIFG